MVGQTISRYRILEKLGEGGMGVVYKAEDTKLDRPVALKFLPAYLLGNEDVRRRFEREAKASAALSHANVCRVYEIDEAEGKTFLAMELIEGESLDKKIARGPLRLEEALSIAQQVAKGLEAAHKRGIVHRDIKPENIMVGDDGHVTIMDFGLAQLTEASRLTKTDETLGTVAYMSPEQTEGSGTDHRTDIWSLGVVLYEMVTGQQPFKGDYDKAVMYSILNEAPEPITSLRTGVPMELEVFVGKCLAKNRDDRYQSAGDIALDLRTLGEKLESGRSAILRGSHLSGDVPTRSPQTLNPTEALPPGAIVVGKRRLHALYGVATAFAVAFLALLGLYVTQESHGASERQTRRFSFSPEGLTSASISPDGRYIAFTAGTQPESSLWLRAIGTETAREIPGTADARPELGWSPDSRFIVFATRTAIKRVGIDGGGPSTLGALSNTGASGFMGVSWSHDGERIVFASSGGLFDVPARGCEPQALVDREAGSGSLSLQRPHFLPAGGGPAALFYTKVTGNASRIWVFNLETGEHTEVGSGSDPVYSRHGYLIFAPSDTDDIGLYAQPFSRASLKPTGDAFPIAANAVRASVAEDGTLIFLDGLFVHAQRTLVWRNRAGELLETIGQPQRAMLFPALSPDGGRVVVASNESGSQDLWVHDLIRSTMTRLTFDEGAERTPSWSPAGDEVIYWHALENGSSVMRRASDGTGGAVALIEAEGNLPNPSLSPTGRYLIYMEGEGGSVGLGADGSVKYNIRYVRLEADGSASEPVSFLATPASEEAPKLSPDGRLLAYASDESGRDEVYVRPFPEGSGRWQASVGGGSKPCWSRNGRELFYVNGDTLMSVSVSTGQGVSLGQPQRLFQSGDLFFRASALTYDVSPDAQRFVTISTVFGEEEGVAPPTVRIVQNWYEEFRDRERE